MVVPRLSLIVLAYNEQATVEGYLRACLAFLDTLPSTPTAGGHEVLLIDDGSTDRTRAIAEAVATDDARVRVLSHPRNAGMGAGMRTGILHAQGELFTILPADGQILPTELNKLLPVAQPGGIVLSVWQRRVDSPVRRLLSRGLRLGMRLLLGTSVGLEGIYLFPVAVARDEIGLDTLGSQTFMFSFELLARAIRSGVPVETVRINMSPRSAGASKVANLPRIARVAVELLRIRWRSG